MASDAKIWLVIAILAVGTYLIRFSFIGLVGDRPLPGWLIKLLRYTPVAVLPGLVAPLVLSPAATDGQFDPPRLLAAIVTLAVAWRFKNLLVSVFAGAAALYLGMWLL